VKSESQTRRRGWSVAIPIGGLRGSAGLGNQAVIMGKAWLGARALRQHYVEVPWTQNPRGYGKELEVTPLDWVPRYALRFASRTRLTTDDYLGWGGLDYEQFVTEVMRDSPRVPRIVAHSSGMVGGFASIAGARGFLRERFLGTRAAVNSPITAELERMRLRGAVVAVHFRAGDFSEDAPQPGTFNRRLPGSWYADTLSQLRSRLGSSATYLLVCEPSAATVQSAREILDRSGIKDARIVSGTPTADLRALVLADILVCSVSSFSMLAAFLSEGRFIWYAPHLTTHDGGWGEIWPASMRPRVPWEDSTMGAEDGRGVAFPTRAETIDAFAADVLAVASRRHPANDLMMFGRTSIIADEAAE
jgi:hypothetical protein